MLCGRMFGAGAALVAVLLCGLPGTKAVAGGPVNTGYFGGVAINGYDTVAYFKDGRAVRGSPDFRHEFLGESWHFSTAENRDTFASNPVAYAPQYGGFCAGEVAAADVSTGITTNVDPEAWKIIDGKLYLFYDTDYADHFEQNADQLINEADAKWPTVEGRLLTQ